jgi:hypothetical protein
VISVYLFQLTEFDFCCQVYTCCWDGKKEVLFLFSTGFGVANLQIKQLLVCKIEGEILAPYTVDWRSAVSFLICY